MKHLYHLLSNHQILRPTDIPDKGILCDLLWADPSAEFDGWRANDRGVSFTFGKDVVTEFLKDNDIDLICRAHQVVEDGYEFFNKRSLVTIFSAPNYCDDFGNNGAVIIVDEELHCSFQVIEAEDEKVENDKGNGENGNTRGSKRRAKADLRQRASTPPKLFSKGKGNSQNLSN